MLDFVKCNKCESEEGSAGKEYLGDGVYAEDQKFRIKLYTSDGINETNVIYLEPDVVEALNNFVKRAPKSG